MATIVRIRDLRTRPPEHGRIRFGKKLVSRGGKEYPTAIETWRFTSPDRDAVEQLAALYGGECRTWEDPKASPQHQFQVETTTSRIQVWLPNDDSYSVAYEQWGGKGLERRCDGEICSFAGIGGAIERPCVCADQAVQTCKPYSRLNVILPQIRFGGVWRLEVKGQAFAHEAPGMIEAITRLQSGGMVRVDLLLTKRTSRDSAGKTMHFVVPQVSVAVTPEEMLAGGAKVIQHIEHPALAALHAAPDDEAVMGELIEPSIWHQPAEDDNTEDAVLIDLLERSVAKITAEREDGRSDLVEDGIVKVEADRRAQRENGWDVRPPDVRVTRNPDPAGPKWVRAANPEEDVWQDHPKPQ